MALVVTVLGETVFDIITAIVGISLGPLLAVYLLGMFLPHVNLQGTLTGLAMGLVCLTLIWILTDIPKWWFGAFTIFPTFIAGAIAVFVSQEGVMKYLGPAAPKYICYPVASISGSVLAVCSCTVLPLFAGISSRGAGLGPATAFLYSGPAINVLAIILTARILGTELGVARAVGAEHNVA